MSTTLDPQTVTAPVEPQLSTSATPATLTPEQTSQNLGVSQTPFLSTIQPNQVYAAPNINQIDVPSTKKASDMKLADLEKKLSKATSTEELNQIAIMNQPKAMGVLTGEASMRSRLDSARINAFNSLYQNRLIEEQRKEAKRQQFIATYGADPNSRPKGMSEREFIKALQGGRFTHLLTPEFKAAQEAQKLDMALKQQQLSQGASKLNVPAGASPELTAVASAYTKFSGDWGKTADYLASQGYDISSGSVIDNELRRRNGLDPIGKNTSPEVVNSWAERIQSGQAKLTDIPASQSELRNQVQVALSQAGNSMDGKPTTTEMGKKAMETAQQLMDKFNSGTGTSAVGMSRMFGLQNIPGTAPADFQQNFETLKSQLSLDAVKFLKGQGQVSDAERALLSNAVSKLSLSQSEGEFKNTLQQIMDTLGGKSNSDSQPARVSGTTQSGLSYTISQ